MHEESVPAGDPRPAAAVKAALRVLALCALLFVPARGISWAAGWLYAALYAGWSAAVVSLLGSRSPDLLRLRELERPAPAHWWDRVFGFAVTSLTFVMLAVCGADSRSASGWGSAARVSAFLAVVLSYALALWALLSNPSAIGASAVRPGQSTAEAGPYSALRHPFYLATAAFFLATPPALGSAAAAVPALLLACAVVFRTAMEDRLLRRSLPGYEAYAARVRYRLLPGIW
ncbi:MAG: isoprenylcysteine carboxylmethyltransferase family protein [Elusimicrobia bacterium]|nr:isoprenylcysteine carboxylmethyltransferase family protein [Elusimicrobiota bacterium]